MATLITRYYTLIKQIKYIINTDNHNIAFTLFINNVLGIKLIETYLKQKISITTHKTTKSQLKDNLISMLNGIYYLVYSQVDFINRKC